jgi:hypothetical protein
MQKRAKRARPVRLIAAVIAALLIAATGSSDAGRFCDGHVRSGAADVRVDAAVGFGLTLYPGRRRSLNGRGVGLAIDPDKETGRCHGRNRICGSQHG